MRASASHAAGTSRQVPQSLSSTLLHLGGKAANYPLFAVCSCVRVFIARHYVSRVTAETYAESFPNGIRCVRPFASSFSSTITIQAFAFASEVQHDPHGLYLDYGALGCMPSLSFRGVTTTSTGLSGVLRAQPLYHISSSELP